MFLNANLPHTYCLLRKEYLYDQRRGRGQYVPCAVFGVTSITGHAVMFTCMTENGAQIDRLPVTAFAWKPCRPLPLGVAQLWDCFSREIAVTEYEYLFGLHCEVLGKDKVWRRGEYLITLDWTGSAYADRPDEGGHKSGHIIRLEDGNFSIMPNNRIFWREASFITKPLMPSKDRPDYLTNSHEWSCEDGNKWTTEDSQRFFYEGGEPGAVQDHKRSSDRSRPSWPRRGKGARVSDRRICDEGRSNGIGPSHRDGDLHIPAGGARRRRLP